MNDAMVLRYGAARDAYRPDRVPVLLIAESPPASGGFFYFPETIGKDPCLERSGILESTRRG